MRRISLKPIWLLLIFISVFNFLSCTPDPYSPSEEWEGRWKIEEEITYPQKKSTSGSIWLNPNNDRELMISGELFGLNSSFIITAKVNTTTTISYERVGDFTIKGTATLNSDKQITFKFTYTSEFGNSESYTRKAIKI